MASSPDSRRRRVVAEELHIDAFPTVAQLIPAAVWVLAFALGLIAMFTVRHVDYPAMRISTRAFLEVAVLMLIIIVIWAAGVGELTPEGVPHGSWRVQALAAVSRHQWLFGVLAGVVGGGVAAFWGAICVTTARRTVSYFKG